MAHHDFPIIILAAGASSRMRGSDKLLEQVDGLPLLALQARRARAATSGDVLIALPPSPHPRYDVLDGLDVIAVPVADASEGINASLRAGFAALPAQTSCAMVLLADLPALRTEDLLEVAQAVDLQSDLLIWRGATSTGKPGHPIVFKAELFAEIARLHGDGGGHKVVEAAQGMVALVPLKDNRARLDLDTPEDWERWRAAR